MTSAAIGVWAVRMDPPAFSVALSCVSIFALAMVVRLVAWVAVAGASFGREERLVAFVALMAIGFGWIGARQWIGEHEFDYQAAHQKADLVYALRDLSLRIDSFAATRDRVAPPRPRPATWQQDEDTFERFEDETVVEYERRFGAKVRMARNLVALRGVTDRDFDAFYRRPANEFQIRVIARKLDGFAGTLVRRRP